MVLITHTGENTSRVDEILDAAQLRFGKYGFDKTTLSEIAADLNLSKASIYYYFPDKSALFSAVVEKEHSLFIQLVEQTISVMENPAEMLEVYVNINISFFKKLLNLSRVKYSEARKTKSDIAMIERFRQRELDIIAKILRLGKEQGIFDYENEPHLGILFLDLLKGLRKISVGRNDIVYLSDADYEKLVSRVKLFMEIFIKGISKER